MTGNKWGKIRDNKTGRIYTIRQLIIPMNAQKSARLLAKDDEGNQISVDPKRLDLSTYRYSIVPAVTA